MTPEQFCYWLQGRAELKPDEVPTPEEWAMIREHLATVFHKVTPPLPTRKHWWEHGPGTVTSRPVTDVPIAIC